MAVRLFFQKFTGVLAMKIHSVRIIAVAAAVVATGAALAINISSTAVSPIYASELIYSANAPIASQVGSSVLGFGVSSGQQRFVRLDVSNATFADAVSNVNTPAAPAASFANSQWVSGGAVGTSSAIFQVTANSAGQSPTDVVQLVVPRIAVTSNGSPVTATYQLFETAAAAVANAGPLFTATGTLARFATGLAVTMTPASARTTVSTGYTKWASAAASGPSNTAALGTIKINNTAAVARDGSTSIALTDFLNATGSTLSVAGDFTAAGASGVYLGSAQTGAICSPLSPVANFTLDTAKTTATLAIPGFSSSAPWSGIPATLCYQVNGTAVIPASSYTATASVGFLSIASGVSGTQVAGASVGSVTRDGTTLQAPFVQVPSGWLVRFVLTNTGSTAAAYTGAVTAGPSNVTGGTANAVATNGTLTGTIPAGGQAIIEGSSLPTFTTSARGFAVFTVSGTNDTINGVYQIVNSTTGSISNMTMVRPVSAYGTQN